MEQISDFARKAKEFDPSIDVSGLGEPDYLDDEPIGFFHERSFDKKIDVGYFLDKIEKAFIQLDERGQEEAYHHASVFIRAVLRSLGSRFHDPICRDIKFIKYLVTCWKLEQRRDRYWQERPTFL